MARLLNTSQITVHEPVKREIGGCCLCFSTSTVVYKNISFYSGRIDRPRFFVDVCPTCFAELMEDLEFRAKAIEKIQFVHQNLMRYKAGEKMLKYGENLN